MEDKKINLFEEIDKELETRTLIFNSDIDNYLKIKHILEKKEFSHLKNRYIDLVEDLSRKFLDENKDLFKYLKNEEINKEEILQSTTVSLYKKELIEVDLLIEEIMKKLEEFQDKYMDKNDYKTRILDNIVNYFLNKDKTYPCKCRNVSPDCVHFTFLELVDIKMDVENILFPLFIKLKRQLFLPEDSYVNIGLLFSDNFNPYKQVDIFFSNNLLTHIKMSHIFLNCKNFNFFGASTTILHISKELSKKFYN